MTSPDLLHLHHAPESLFLWRLAAWDGTSALAGPGPETDWDLLIALSQRAKAVTVLARWVSTADLAIPEDVARRLAGLSAVYTFRLAQMSERLAGVVRDLNRAGVQPLLLKGAALHCTHYSSPTDRPMNDIDLLVRRRDIGQAVRVAADHGWTAPQPGVHTEFYWSHHHLAPMADETGAGIPFELHTDLVPPGHPFALTTADVLRDSGTVSLPGGTARVPSRNHLLLHNIIHWAWSHAMAFGTWTSLRDTAFLTRDRAISWSGLTREVIRCRAATCAYWNLRLAGNLSGVEIPQEVVTRLEPSLPQPLADLLERHISAQALSLGGHLPVWLMQGLWRMAVQPVWSRHGSVLPWQRDRVFTQGSVASSDTGMLARRLRGTMRAGRYLLGLRPGTEGS